ncbi:head completion/stabilization protein [Variovorax sp. YR216]|uniref:head completion/stabilization protein n=1 Tax=Variovorax sp. YR216 TaxID=1882828 RepID=UPI000898ECB9|nr:head completion/stabilization protein [Variovorax sp. YR216]SEA50801.1 Phage head completion protein (GPL) [Variovorax sp. YR216]
MSFLANPPTPAPGAEKPLANDGWFPDIDLAQLRATARLDGTVTPDRLRYSALAAVLSINTELAPYKVGQQMRGHAKLAEVPAPEVDGVNVQVTRYLRAVYSYVQADLVERYRDFDTTGAGDKAADKLEQRIDELRREVRWAISDLLGMRRTTVELI